MTVKDIADMKFAVTLFGPSIVRFSGFAVPLKLPDQLLNTYPAFATAVNWTTVPESYQVWSGERVILPPPEGEAVVVNWYWACQSQVTEEPIVITKEGMLVSGPLVTFPVPVCPVQTY
jgi:hypothetical protein